MTPILFVLAVSAAVGAQADAIAAPVPAISIDAAAQPVVAPLPRLTPQGIDQLVANERNASIPAEPIGDERFLRRVSLDLVGRQPSPAELDAFLADVSPDKRARAIDRLLDSPEFGVNWADYWSDAVSYHVPQPELTFLNYDPFKAWLAGEFNSNSRWDAIVKKILTARGRVKENPAATFVGFHEANPVRLASETSRICLGIQIQCAECHDHPYDDWKREQFHQMAAFFARSSAELPWNDSHEIVVSAAEKGEYRMPDAADPRKQGKEMTPAFLTGTAADAGIPDDVRRSQLARFVTGPDSPWFAESFVNRVWARLMGQGFCEPVDNIGENQLHSLPQTHAALAAEFRTSGYDVKQVYRLVMNSRGYQQEAAQVTKLRGDEVFRSLSGAIELANVRPPAVKATEEIRFPVPPKSTQETIAETFGFDPSRSAESVMRTMGQALLMMNNEQLQAQIDADAESGTVLSRLLAVEKDDRAAFGKLVRLVLARRPTEAEVEIALEHVGSLGERGAAFEDLLWSLLNSTEFTTRR